MHLGVLVVLTLIVISKPPEEQLLRVEATTVEPEDPLTTSEEFTYAEMPQEEIGATSAGNANASFAAAPALSLEPTPAQMEVEEHEIMTEPVVMGEEIRLATGPMFSENLSVKGAAGTGAVGTGGVIDKLTQELLLSLEERPTLVVWLFDQSGSLARQRDEMMKRFDRIYEELGVIEAANKEAFKRNKDKPLLTSIAEFGQNVTFLTPKPTDDIDEIKAAVRSVKTDPSGVEHTFGAISATVDRYRALRTQEPAAQRDDLSDDRRGGRRRRRNSIKLSARPAARDSDLLRRSAGPVWAEKREPQVRRSRSQVRPVAPVGRCSPGTRVVHARAGANRRPARRPGRLGLRALRPDATVRGNRRHVHGNSPQPRRAEDRHPRRDHAAGRPHAAVSSTRK